jgi:hypothetical protein
VSHKRFGLIPAGAELKGAFWYPQCDATTALVSDLGLGGGNAPDFAGAFTAS